MPSLFSCAECSEQPSRPLLHHFKQDFRNSFQMTDTQRRLTDITKTLLKQFNSVVTASFIGRMTHNP